MVLVSLLLLFCVPEMVTAQDCDGQCEAKVTRAVTPTPEKIEIALLGDSITAGVANDNYGAYLQDMLGDDYRIINYGVGGVCLTKRCRYPIWETWAYPTLIDTTPEFAVVMLGTNDVGITSDEVFADYENDLMAMVESLQDIASKPQILLATPPPMYGISQEADDRMTDTILPAIKRVANTYNLQVIDVYHQVDDYPDNYPDNLHPNLAGHQTIANIFYAVFKDTPLERPSGAMILEGIHAPSQLVRSGDHLLLYANTLEQWAYDLNTQTWDLPGDDIYDGNPPTWVDGNKQFGTPALIQLDETHYRLYHSAVVDEASQVSKIGFAEGVGQGRDIVWSVVDDFVLQSETVNQPFALDPSVFTDDEGRIWLVYGSHGAGIYMVELNPDTGFLRNLPQKKTADGRFFHIADYGGSSSDSNAIEGAYIYNHPDTDYYYLFVNWGHCCNEDANDYHIRVGRSTSPTGPYLDKAGVDLADGGGTMFLDAEGDILGHGRFIAPGQAGIYRHSDGLDYFSHHFYDGENGSKSTWALWQLDWVDGWARVDTDHVVDLTDD